MRRFFCRLLGASSGTIFGSTDIGRRLGWDMILRSYLNGPLALNFPRVYVHTAYIIQRVRRLAQEV